MNKILKMAATLGLIASGFALNAAAGGMNTFDGITYTNLLATRCSPGVTVTNASVPVNQFQGQVTILVTVQGGTTNITDFGATVQVQESSANTNQAAGWTNISALATTARSNLTTVSTYKLDTDSQKHYLRGVLTCTNDTAWATVTLIGFPQQ